MPKLMRETNRSGFSIVEVLSVCVVISVLAAVLMPLLPVAKSAAYRQQCASNLRQFADAFSLYSNDWSGYWPSPGGQDENKCYWAKTGRGGLRGYIRLGNVKSVWCCPLAKIGADIQSPRSYYMNSYLRTPADIEYENNSAGIHRGVDVDKVSRPAKTILLYEGVSPADDVAARSCYASAKLYYASKCGNWQYVRGYTAKGSDRPAHGRLNNYLYCDSHVVARSPGRPVLSTLSSYSEMYQWHVDKAAYEVRYADTWGKKNIPRD
ncbi:MAG: type II secretion system protein [Armatimonadota bacterium]